MKYNINVNHTHKHTIDVADLEQLDLSVLTPNEFHLLKDNQSYQVSVKERNFSDRKYIVEINGTTYKVDIESKIESLIKQMGFENGATKKVNQLKAPMPGLVLDITIAVGDQVNQGDNIMILEAMKMENSLTAPMSGKVKNIAVNKGQAVDKGQLLIEFE
ncbi:MAG: biotin/lipoyl-containing protein [Bacteroidota bacterium]|nr:biotin/lipoyl-containing protein [Bacteroidota bacterium]